MRIVISLVLLVIVLYASALGNCTGKKKNCIKAAGKNKCTKGEGSCENEKVCMAIQRSVSDSIKLVCAVPQEECCWCDPTLTSTEACEEGLSCQNVNGEYKCLEAESTGPSCDSVDRKWKFVYSHDSNGNPLNNTDLITLLTAIRHGAEVKVVTKNPLPNVNEPHPFYGVLSTQKLSFANLTDNAVADAASSPIRTEAVRAQSLHQTFLFGPSQSFNLFRIASTTRVLHATQFAFGSPSNTGRVNQDDAVAMEWYIRETFAPVHQTALVRSILDGSDVKVGRRRELLGIDNSIENFQRLDMVRIQPNDLPTGMSYVMATRQDGEGFTLKERAILRNFSYTGDVHSEWRFLNNESTVVPDIIAFENQELDWFVGGCWDLVFRHDETGARLSGSKNNLIDAIANGKRIKVKVDDTFYEANVIYVEADEVKVHVFDSYDTDVESWTWNWLNISTDGSVKTVEVLYGSDQIISDDTENKAIAWFAHNREMEFVGPHNPTGGLDPTEIGILNNAYESAYDFRFMISRDDGTNVWYEAESINNFLLTHEREVYYDGQNYFRRYTFVTRWNHPLYPTLKASQLDYMVGSDQEAHRATFTNEAMWYIGQ